MREQARELFETIHALSKKGMKNAQVARELGIHRHTVEKYLAFKAPPVRRDFTKGISDIAPHKDYILGRWQQGYRNVTKIHKESPSKATPASTTTSHASPSISKSRNASARPVPDRSPGISASHAAGVLVKRPEHRSEEEDRTLRRLKKVHWSTERCCSLFEDFAVMLRDREQRDQQQSRSRLEEWTERAKAPASLS